jgi:hypothetical protein
LDLSALLPIREEGVLRIFICYYSCYLISLPPSKSAALCLSVVGKYATDDKERHLYFSPDNSYGHQIKAGGLVARIGEMTVTYVLELRPINVT